MMTRLITWLVFLVITFLITLWMADPSVVHQLPSHRFAVILPYDRAEVLALSSRLTQSLEKSTFRHGFRLVSNPRSLWDPEGKTLFNNKNFSIYKESNKRIKGIIIITEKSRGNLSFKIKGTETFSGLNIMHSPFSQEFDIFEHLTKQIEDDILSGVRQHVIK